MILIHDPETDRLVFRYVLGPTAEVTDCLVGRAIDAGQGIAGAVFRAAQGTITADAAAEQRHCREIDLTTHYTTRNMVTVPLMAHGCRPVGVMQILNRRVGTFDQPDFLPPDIHIFTASKQPWVVLPPGAPAVPEYYDRDQHWPPESLARRQVLLPQIEAHKAKTR